MSSLAFLLHAVFTAPLLLLPPPGLHLLLRLLAGLPYPTMVMLPLVIGLETMGSTRRAFTVIMCSCSWTAGALCTILVAYLLPHWQHLALLSCLPALLALISWRLVPESPSWLMSKGRVDACVGVMEQIARVNQRSVPSSELKAALLSLQAPPATVQLQEVLRYPRLRLRTLCLLVLAVCYYMAHGILFLGVNIMPTNYFLSHSVTTTFQMPGNIVCLLGAHYLGRRFTALLIPLFMLALGIASFSLDGDLELLIVSGLMSIGSQVGTQVMYVLVPEVFPTPVRSSCFGVFCVFNSLAMVASPYIVHSSHGPRLRFWVISGLMVTAVVAALPLPETLGLALPQTFQEAEDLGCGRPRTSWVHHWNQHKYPSHRRRHHHHSTATEALVPLQDPHHPQQEDLVRSDGAHCIVGTGETVSS